MCTHAYVENYLFFKTHRSEGSKFLQAGTAAIRIIGKKNIFSAQVVLEVIKYGGGGIRHG